MKSNYSIRKFTIVAAFACVCFVAAPASAGNNLKNGFEDQLGRLLAVEVINLGHGVLAPQRYPVYRQPYYRRPYYRRPEYPAVPRPYYRRPYYVNRDIYSHCNYTDPTVMVFCINSANESLWRHTR